MESEFIVKQSETGEVLMGPAVDIQKIMDANLSDRAKRTKLSAAFRPDAQWREGEIRYYQKVWKTKIFQATIVGSEIITTNKDLPAQPSLPITTTNDLSQLVAEADAHLVAMRKIVH